MYDASRTATVGTPTHRQARQHRQAHRIPSAPQPQTGNMNRRSTATSTSQLHGELLHPRGDLGGFRHSTNYMMAVSGPKVTVLHRRGFFYVYYSYIS